MSYLTRTGGAAPATPASGKSTTYTDTTGRSRELNSTGVDNVLTQVARDNVVRNSGSWFWQRQAPGTLATYSTVGGRLPTGPDSWFSSNENASIQAIRVDAAAAPETGLQSRYYGTFTKITSTGKFAIGQVIEGVDLMPLRGRSVRLQCRMKRATSDATVRMFLIQLTSSGTQDLVPSTAGNFITAWGANTVDPTLGTNLSYIAPKSGITADGGTVDGNGIDCPVVTAWTRFGAVFDVPSSCKNLIVLFVSDSQVAAAAGFSLSDVSLVDGMEIQDYTARPYVAELQRCQRFYTKTFAVDTAPVQNAGVNTGEYHWAKVVAGATAARSPSFILPVPFRVAAPTVTTYNPAVANAQVRDKTNAVDCSATAAVFQGDRSVVVTCTGNAATVAEGHLAVHLTIDGEL